MLVMLLLGGCASNGTKYAPLRYSRYTKAYPQIPNLVFHDVNARGVVTMFYTTDKCYRLHARSGQPLQFNDGEEVSDYRVGRVSYNKQEVVLLYAVKWGGKLQ